MTAKSGKPISTEQLDAAIAWHVRLHSGDAAAADWAAFTVWLEENPAHPLAFDDVEAIYGELDGLANNAVEFPGRMPAPRVAANGRVFPLKYVAGASALALLAATLLLAFGLERSATSLYETKRGEAMTVSLADGTILELNTNSKIAITQTRSARRARLDKGEVLFRVAKDISRPFTVEVGDREVRDIGTVFDILRNESLDTITVSEGRVAVMPASAPSQNGAGVVQLVAGDQLVHREGTDTAITNHVDPARALAWRNGYLAYENAPLSQVVADINRYFANPITVEGTLASKQFSGVLKMDNEEAVLKRLTEFMPMAVERADNGKITLRAGPGNQ